MLVSCDADGGCFTLSFNLACNAAPRLLNKLLCTEPAKSIRCRVPVDTDAAIRVSQVLQLASLVQALHKQVHQAHFVALSCVCKLLRSDMHTNTMPL